MGRLVTRLYDACGLQVIGAEDLIQAQNAIDPIAIRRARELNED